MKKKQLLMTAVLVILVIILIFSQRFFNNNFKQVALLDNDISSLEEFSMKNQGYSYSIPETWVVKEKAENSYKLYQAEFNSEEKNIMGYVELLSTEEDVKVLAQKDIDNLALKHSNENIENYSCNGYKGIKLEYTTKVENGYSFINTNYYLRLGDTKVGKFAFTAKKGSYKDNMNAIYDVIVSSISAQKKYFIFIIT